MKKICSKSSFTICKLRFFAHFFLQAWLITLGFERSLVKKNSSPLSLLQLICLLSTLFACLFSNLAFATAPKQSIASAAIANALGWVEAPGKNVCNGYYSEPAIVLNYPTPAELNKAVTTITAENQVVIEEAGALTLEGRVTATQPGRQVVADKAYLFRNPKTGKVEHIELVGHVQMRQAGKLVVAERVDLDLVSGAGSAQNALYRLSRPTLGGHVINVRGSATRVDVEQNNIMHLKNGTYTACAPEDNTWYIGGREIDLNKATGRGIARDASFYIKDSRIFSLPYMSFPIDNRRTSGFLTPSVGHTIENGFDIKVPYYFNLAPNYDFTFTPRILTERNVMAMGFFRFLTTHMLGELDFGFLPNDRRFNEFRQDTLAQYNGNPLFPDSLENLRNYSNNRGFISFFDEIKFDSHWTAEININRVTDDYYFLDLGGARYTDYYKDQLINQAKLSYADEHWNVSARVLDYQTLHPITQAPVEEQYRRLPELSFSGIYPDQLFGLTYQLNGEFDYFDHRRTVFNAPHIPVTVGTRTYLRPGVSWPVRRASGFFVPQLQLDAVTYSLSNRPLLPFLFDSATGLFEPPPNNLQRVLPLFNIDSGLFFDRTLQFLQNSYTQTLEPRLYYLYVPFKDQRTFPNFDTTLPSFNFEQMFQNNRFVGEDRIGDANQITLAVTTRFLDRYSGAEKLRASIGAIYFFQKPRVQIDFNPIETDSFNDVYFHRQYSPLVGELSYQLSPAWSATTTNAWDIPNKRLTNSSAGFHYQTDSKHILNIGYQFVRAGDPFGNAFSPTVPANLSRINVSGVWPLVGNWSMLGNWNYNLSHSYPQTYFYGLQYDSCCWSARLVASKVFRGFNNNNQLNNNNLDLQYDNGVYLQIQLKGLGVLSTRDPTDLLRQISGYSNDFREY